LEIRFELMSLPKYRPPAAAASVLSGVPGASVALAAVLNASGAMAATVAVTAPIASIRRRDALPGDPVVSDAGRDRHIFMALLFIESYRRHLR
jgi:hypothetical protein